MREIIQGQKHYTYIDFMRIIACILVITIHVTATPVVSLRPFSTPQLLFIVINRLSKPSVPLFIFISGYLTYRPGKKFQLTSKTRRLILPYTAWTGIYYALFVVTGIYPLSANFFFKHLLIGDMMYHLYFMVIMIQLTLLTPVLLKFPHTKLPFIMILIQFISACFHFPYQDRLFITYIGYYGMGFAVKQLTNTGQSQNKSHVPYHVFTLLLGVIYTVQYWLALNMNIMVPQWVASMLFMSYSLTACTSVYFLCRNLDNLKLTHTKQDIWKTLGKATETIYYAHPLAILFSSYAANRIGLLSISLQSLLAAVIIFICIITPAYYFQKVHMTKC